jgi:hypothetical protein
MHKKAEATGIAADHLNKAARLRDDPSARKRETSIGR